MRELNYIEVKWDNRLVGRLTVNSKGIALFEYDSQYLKHGVSVSPFELPLKSGVFEAKPFPFIGNFGIFEDSLPDGWGMLVLHRFLQSKGIDIRKLNITELLSFVGTNGRGALEYFPDKSITNSDPNVDLEFLSNEANKILKSDNYNGAGLKEFQERGGSSGGARPKLFINLDGKEWLVKFKAQNDPDNIGKIEYEYSLLAKECGILMPETRLLEGKYFATERFDRNKDRKLHVVTVAGLLRADYRLPSIDYKHIFQVANNLTHDEAELWKIYRLMAFNFIIGNKDDHAKNFSFIFKDGKWEFSPAYDLLPSHGINGYHTTSINDKILPSKKDLIDLATLQGLQEKEALRIYDEIETKYHAFKTLKERF